MIPIVSFIGRSNSGKTTLLEQIVNNLTSMGFRVGVIKHSPHGFEIDHEGKDTWRFSEAGAGIIAVMSPDRIAIIEKVAFEPTLDNLKVMFEGKVDILITEGYKSTNTPKIVVLGTDRAIEKLAYQGETLAVISSRLSPSGIPEFRPADILEVIAILEKRIHGTQSKVVHVSKVDRLMAESAAFHGHLCPGQVLGVRMAVRGCQELGIENPAEENKRLVVFVEIDRCAADAIQIVTGCKLGKRTMKHIDYGKLAATFVDVKSGNALRIAVRTDTREGANRWYHPEWTRQDVEVAAYKAMSDDELFSIERVVVRIPEEDMPGPPIRRVVCEQCGEEVNDDRDVTLAGKTLCRYCAYGGYYQHYQELVGIHTTGHSG